MNAIELKPLPITARRFAAFGEVIEASAHAMSLMNQSRFERFEAVARIDTDSPPTAGIVRSRAATQLPYHVEMLERHPHGSQAFIPLARFSFVIVVAPPGESVDTRDLRAFSVGPAQGVNYGRGTWHMPLIALEEGQSFLVVEQETAAGPNCDERLLADPVILCAP
jgi:ureidoglycolate lyase